MHAYMHMHVHNRRTHTHTHTHTHRKRLRADHACRLLFVCPISLSQMTEYEPGPTAAGVLRASET